MAACTPGIILGTGCENCQTAVSRGGTGLGIPVDSGARKVGLQAEIDTSPPFGSVKEAVTRFGGSGSWLPSNKYRDGYEVGNIDIKKVEEQAVELEKDLIVKELETLDVLEEITTTKKIVQELKLQLQLQKEALRGSAFRPKEVSSNKDVKSERRPTDQPLYPDQMLIGLKQAKLNLEKTMGDLGVIQESIESLNKSMQEEKGFLAKTRRRLTSNFAGVLSPAQELKSARGDDIIGTGYRKHMDKLGVAEISGDSAHDVLDNLRTAELRFVAAQKMKEAAKAAEAVALAEIKSLNGHKGYALPVPGKTLAFEPSALIIEPRTMWPLKKKAEVNISRMSILKRLKNAREEVKESKLALEEALNKVEVANRKQLATEEVLRKWIPEVEDREERDGTKGISSSHPKIEDSKPACGSNISDQNSLRRKQQSVSRDGSIQAKPTKDEERDALSSLHHELKRDSAFRSTAHSGGEESDRKQFLSQRKKFGFIHIALPLTKLTRKKRGKI